MSETLYEVAGCTHCHAALKDDFWGLHREVCTLIDVVFILARAIQTSLFV